MKKPITTRMKRIGKKPKEVNPVVEEASPPVVEENPPPVEQKLKVEHKLEIVEEGYVEVLQTLIGRKNREAKTIKIRPFITTPARVEVSAKRYLPLGHDAGGVSVSVSISAPCYNEETIIFYKELDQLVDKIMELKLKKITGGS
jgi:hypothetical protein